MTVTEIALAAVAAMIVVAAALVMVLSIPDREGRLPTEPRHARRPADPQTPPPGLVHGRWTEDPSPGSFGPKNRARDAGPPGYGPPPLWGDANRDPY